NSCRGVTYWSDGKNDGRIFYTAGSYLWCISSETGKPINAFGDGGKIDLHVGLGDDVKDQFVTATSPGTIYKDLLVMGSRVNEGHQAAPGHIRAFDVRTGKMKWIFKTIPQPGETGYESWKDKDAWKTIGAANSWGGMSLDQEKGILFATTGSANYDWWGGNRKGNNLFADCLLAIDAATGKRLWHFQHVHHDIWDKDLPAAPALVTINKNGTKTEAVALTTKTGFVYIFDRVSGKPVYEIVEKHVPVDSDLEGEELSPTQPYPTAPAPFVRQSFTEADINSLLPDSSIADIKKRWTTYRRDHMYAPISLRGTIQLPGLDGGAEWGGPSYDPETGILYINANEMAWVIQGVPMKKEASEKESMTTAGERLYRANCMSCHGADKNGSGNFPTLIGSEKKYSPAGFDTLLQTGRRMMPAFRELPALYRQAIASYVLNEKTTVIFQDTFSNRRKPLPYTIAGYNKFLSKEGLPAISPPWGTLSAINLNTGEYVWKKPLGNDSRFPAAQHPTGTENYGGSVITAGGLLIIAATSDSKLRIFNKRDGTLLHEINLPASAFATPSVYSQNGKQFIAVACGGGKLNTKSGDSYIAFSLPVKK
ncbi:MAG: PQQ-binding-like beta-propeller repeat protein, partial [Gemmatimonadaceae bacterium]|nr:PQQ-binding-like beta-propeller repeat protein [Chitinophagaceae bacterium]